MELKDDDLIVLTRVGKSDFKKYIQVHQYDAENNKFENISKEVAELTDRNISKANNTFGAIMVSGGGMDMNKALIDDMYSSRDKANGNNEYAQMGSDRDYFNTKAFTALSTGDKKLDKDDITLYNKIDSWDYHPTFEDMDRLTPYKQKEAILTQFVEKQGYNSSTETALDLVKASPYAFKFLSEDRRNDIDVVQAHIDGVGYQACFERFGSEIINNDDFMKSLIVDKGHLAPYEYASKDIRGDEELSMAVIKEWPDALKFATEEIQGNKKIVIEAIKADRWASNNASNDIKDLLTSSSANGPEEQIKALETAIDLEQKGYKVNPNISIYSQKESFDMASTLKEELNTPKVEEKSAKDKYLEDFARQNQASASKTKTGAMKI